MDAINMVAIFARVFLIIFAPVLALMVYNIYRKTRGGSLGWVYMMLAFLSLGTWALFQVILLFVFDSFEGRALLGALMFGLLSIFTPLSSIKLAKDMKCSLPGWINERNTMLIMSGFFVLMYAYALVSSSNILGSAAGISMIALTPSFIISFIGLNSIGKATGVRLWSVFAWGGHSDNDRLPYGRGGIHKLLH